MPSVGSDFSIDIFTRASDLPQSVWLTFQTHPCDSNVMYPHTEALRAKEMAGGSGDNVWITCTSSQPHSPPTLDFVLSCTDGYQGGYPVFLFTTLPYDSLSHPTDYTRRRVNALVRALQRAVPTERVFSVFAPEPLTRLFATLWTAATGVQLDADPEYYAAKFPYCTSETFRPRRSSLFPDITFDLRPARPDDLKQVAELCYGFAKESEPFVLTMDGATREAERMITNNQVWVHEIAFRGKAPEIASIVATTRTSETVAAITKVFTNPRWRKRGCAERLTRQVCKHLLKSKDKIVLYVAHNNPAAAKVYHRVGFVGLDPNEASSVGVDNWLELGFDRKHVILGHW